MIAALCMVAIHGAVFVEQEYAGPFPFWRTDSGYSNPGYRACDLDGDGFTDLLLGSEAIFQRDGAFRNENRHALPDFGESAICQAWDRDIYFRMAARLEVIRWEDSGWKRVLSQQIDWPLAGDLEAGDGPQEAGRAAVNRFGGYLYDLNGDGVPEIAVAGPDGVHVYRRNGAFFEPAGVLNIYPPVRLEPRTDVTLWPEHDRTIQPPTLDRSCSYRFEGNRVTVVYGENLLPRQYRLRTARYTLLLQDNDGFILGPATETASEVVEGRSFGGIRLNDDDTIDFLKVDWRKIYQSSLPMPIVDMKVSTNAGKDFVTLQMIASVADPLIVDLNEDGRQDLVLQGTGYFDGGLRETVLRVTSRRRVDLLTHVYLQTESNTFTDSPSIVDTFDVELDKPPIQWSEMARILYDGEILNLEGDFDGDGYHDAAVHDRPDRIAIYLGSPEGFANKPYAEAAATPNSVFFVADFDGDGRSDMVVSHPETEDPATPLRDEMFLLRDSAP